MVGGKVISVCYEIGVLPFGVDFGAVVLLLAGVLVGNNEVAGLLVGDRVVGLGVVDVTEVLVVVLSVLVVVVEVETQLPSILLITGWCGTQRLFEPEMKRNAETYCVFTSSKYCNVLRV